jgi:hypothetical protein
MSDFSDAFNTPSSVTAGWSRLGQVLGGNNQVQMNAFQRGALQGAQTADVMEKAARQRDANLGFSAITSDLVRRAQAGDPAAIADLTSDQFHAGGGNASEMANALKTSIGTSALGQALSRANAGANISDINTDLAVAEGKPVDTTRITDNTVYNPYGDSNQQTAPTAIGSADIGRLVAATAAERAAAAEHTAGAARDYADINTPVIDAQGHYELLNRGNASSHAVTGQDGQPLTARVTGAAGGQMSSPKPEEFEQAFGKPKVGGQPNPAYADFANFQAAQAQVDPRYNDGSFALKQYLYDQRTRQMGAHDFGPGAKGGPPSGFSAAIDNATDPSTAADTPSSEPDHPSSSSLSDLITGGKSGTAPAPVSSIAVGQTATNPKTGAKIQWNGTAWVPANGG